MAFTIDFEIARALHAANANTAALGGSFLPFVGCRVFNCKTVPN